MKSNVKLLSIWVMFFTTVIARGQAIIPDLKDTALWQVSNREVTRRENNLVELSASSGDGMLALKGPDFGDGTIELDIKGENKPGQSFVGLAFNIRSETIFDCVYFRPFNFRNDERKAHSVQYINSPAYSWELLRNNFPGKYENEIQPAPDPDEWFHARITFLDKTIKVYVNNEMKPSLTVERISILNGGKIGFWVGNGSSGSFRNLEIMPAAPSAYGYDETRGKYFEVAHGTKLYYEIYGEGEPILLLHGGVYGYIDEFEFLIKELSKTNRVICLATRGHVKSDIGHEPFSYDQRAADAKKLLDHLGITRTTVIGFSDGGYSAYKLAANYPAMVEKMVVIGAGDRPKGSKEGTVYSANDLMKTGGDYFKKRVAAMPEPQRWDESLQMINKLYSSEFVSSETFTKIKCPALLIAGDQDNFSPPESVVKAHRALVNSRLAIIAGCGHVVLYCNWQAVWNNILPFIHPNN